MTDAWWPLFLYKNRLLYLFPSIFRKKIKKSDCEKLHPFYFFDSKRGKFMFFSIGYDEQFFLSPECYFFPNRVTPVTNIFKSIWTKNSCNKKFILIIFNTWSSLSQIKSTVKTSLNSVLFHTSYLQNKRSDPPPPPPNFFASLAWVGHYLTAGHMATSDMHSHKKWGQN